MQRSLVLSPAFSRPGYLAQVTLVLLSIRDTHASGRLSIRNGEQFGLVHLYFKQARLVHITGDKRDGETLLNDLLSWSKGTVRFDRAITVAYEDVTWQQAQIFTRWLSFLEMRARLHSLLLERVSGLTQDLTAALPAQPLGLPQEVARSEEYRETSNTHSWQRPNDGVNHELIEHTLPKEQCGQLQQVSQTAAQRMNGLVQQAAALVQRRAKQAASAAQESIRSVAGVAQHTSRHVAIRLEAVRQPAVQKKQAQSVIQTAQISVQSKEQEVSQTEDHSVNSQSPLRPLRPVRFAPVTPSITGKLGEEV